MRVLHGLLLTAFLVVLPLASILQARWMARADPDGELLRGSRALLYRDTVIALSLFGLVALLVGLPRLGAEAMWLGWPGWGALTGWTALAVGAGLAATAVAHLIGVIARIPERTLLELLLPDTRNERWAFAGVSVAAGVGEELAFRSFALASILPQAGVFWSIALTSMAFGAGHAYQGPLGIARTSAMGAAMAWVVLAAGSIWPAVLAHALLNLILGIGAGRHLLRRSSSPTLPAPPSIG